MSRTYRRRGQRHEYRWVLRDWKWKNFVLIPALLEARSEEGRRAIARFHSDAESTLRNTAPRRYRRTFDHRLNTFNVRQLRRWIDDHDYDPMFHVRHRHNATWSWW
jgi:hypothetical protein